MPTAVTTAAPRRRRWPRILLLLLLLALLAAAAAGGWTVSRLRASLPQLDGEYRIDGLGAAVRVARDAAGVPTLDAADRADAALALGFLHAQERFFQMDLLRRLAAGELSALVGAAALAEDRDKRPHRFRYRAEQTLAALPRRDSTVLNAYRDGVNAGLDALGAAPFEYLLIGREPQPWRAADSLLVVYAMYLRLQGGTPVQERLHGRLAAALPAPLYAFLTAPGSALDAPLDGSRLPAAPLPEAAAVDYHALMPSGAADAVGTAVAGLDPVIGGSNAWAVAGARSAHGGALLANDIHLDLTLPNSWYRASLRFRDGGREHRVTGVTLPGMPAVVAGSNGRIAWGFTNSYGDWSDLIEVRPAGPGRYRTVDGAEPYRRVDEIIAVADAAPVTLSVYETRWGPLLPAGDSPDDGRPLQALRWVAHDADAVDLELLALETAEGVDAALAIANRAGMPSQNIHVADADGRIGWTLTGPIPLRVHADGRRPQHWDEAGAGWYGRLPADAYPRVVDPPDGIVWSANARTLGGSGYALIGDGGYALGARARQIRDALRALPVADEAAMLAIQLDHRARWLAPWRALLREHLARRNGDGRRDELARLLAAWDGRAGVDAAAYRLLREWREQVAARVFAPVDALLYRHAAGAGAIPDPAVTASAAALPSYRALRQIEAPLLSLLRARPDHLLDPRFDDWDALLADATAALLARYPDGALAERTWGERNRLAMRHPLSRFVPLAWLRERLEMPAVALPGGVNVPRVQGPDKGASQRMAVSPGREEQGYFHMPGGQSGHPLSPYYGAGHEAWVQGRATPFLPGPTAYTLMLKP